MPTSPPPPSRVPVETTTWGEGRRLAHLAWPVVLAQLGIVALGAEDVLLVGRLGGEALAAVSAGHLWSFAVLLAGLGTMRGLDPLFAQAHGAGDKEAGAAALWRAFILALVISVPVTVAHLLAEPALRLLNQPAEIIPVAGEYCRVVALGIVPAMLLQALTQFLQGMGQMRLPLIAVIAANIVNLALDIVAVYGLEVPGVLSVPALGPVGCGWATTGARVAWLATLVWLARPLLRQYKPPLMRILLAPRAFARVLADGLPVGLQTGLEVWAFSAAGVLMGMLGTTELAAHAVTINVVSVTFMIPFGIGAAAATRVGNLVGAGHRWQRAAWVSVGMGTGWMALTSTVLVLAPHHLARFYTEDAAVIALAASLFPVTATFQLADGVQAVTFGVLRGAGDTRWPALANVIGYWMVGLPLAWWIGVHHGPDPIAVWQGLALGIIIVSVLVLARLVWRGRVGAINRASG